MFDYYIYKQNILIYLWLCQTGDIVHAPDNLPSDLMASFVT